MIKTTKSPDTLTKLQNLITLHAAATSPRPAESVVLAVPQPAKPGGFAPSTQTRGNVMTSAAVPSAPVSPPVELPERLSVQIIPRELRQVDALILDVHQRLGERVTVSELLRVGLSRIGQERPVTREELQAQRLLDRRRNRRDG